MQQRTVEKPDKVRIEGCSKPGFVEVVITANVTPVKVVQDNGDVVEEYESDIYRVTYPERENLQEYAEQHADVFEALAIAEEKAGEPTPNADALAALMIENGELRSGQDDLIIMVADMLGGAI